MGFSWGTVVVVVVVVAAVVVVVVTLSCPPHEASASVKAKTTSTIDKTFFITFSSFTFQPVGICRFIVAQFQKFVNKNPTREILLWANFI